MWVAGWRSGGCGIEEGVEAAGFRGRSEGSGKGKHVLRGGDDGVRARGGDFNPVGKVETRCDEVWNRLLSVLRPEARQERVETRDIAGYCDGVDAGIDRAEQRGHSAATGTSKGADAVRIDFGTRL